MREIVSSFFDIYERYCGRGRLIPLFLAALIILILIGITTGRKTHPILFFLSVWTAIAHAFAKALTFISSENKKWIRWIALVFIVVAVLLSGTSVWSATNLESGADRAKREEDYREVFETILAKDPHAGVLASPGMMPYFGLYSADFRLLYELPSPGEEDLLSKEDRMLYDAFSSHHPDFSQVRRLSRGKEPFFAVVDKEGMWPENIYESGFDLLTTVDHYDIYYCAGGVNE